jgi:hypothetical protein
VTAGRRDLGAARTCLIAWLASIGFLALGKWALTVFASRFPNGDRLWAFSGEFNFALLSAETVYAIVLTCFWLLVFALGTARTRPATRTAATANALLIAALLAALLFCFLHAAPGLFANWIDACTR